MYNTYSRLFVIPLLICFLLAMSGCSNDQPKNEKDFIDGLNASTDYIAPPIEVDKCEIEKRRTDEELGTDLIYVTVSGSNNDISCSLSYILTYELYNEGWMMETIERDREGDWSFVIVNPDDIIEDIQNISGLQDDSEWRESVSSIEITDQRLPEYSDNPFEVIITADLHFSGPEKTGTESYEMHYDFSEGRSALFMCQNLNYQNSSIY